jgi:hypothetical protein
MAALASPVFTAQNLLAGLGERVHGRPNAQTMGAFTRTANAGHSNRYSLSEVQGFAGLQNQ